jgi:hypothetical protein
MKFKTTEDLKLEWGQERFVEALGYLSGITVNGQFQGTVEQLNDLYINHNDTFEVHKALVMEEAEKIIHSEDEDEISN